MTDQRERITRALEWAVWVTVAAAIAWMIALTQTAKAERYDYVPTPTPQEMARMRAEQQKRLEKTNRWWVVWMEYCEEQTGVHCIIVPRQHFWSERTRPELTELIRVAIEEVSQLDLEGVRVVHLISERPHPRMAWRAPYVVHVTLPYGFFGSYWGDLDEYRERLREALR